MTDAPENLDDRLARLAARRAGAKPASTAAPNPAPLSAVDASGDLVPRRATPPARPAKRKRRHAAGASRIIAAGLSTSAFFSIVAALGAQTSSGASTTAGARPHRVPTPTTTPRPKVVVKERHHVVYVDAAGNPISLTDVTAAAASGGASLAGFAPAAGSSTWSPARRTTGGYGGSTSPVYSAPSTSGGSSAYRQPASAPVAAPVSHSGPGAAPAPAPAPAPTPPPTSPPQTSPPVTAPAPPPPPACTGSKCR